MTAGSGIFHQEMPKLIEREDGQELLRSNGSVKGFQLWINLPAKMKMSNPVYRSIKPENVPVVELERGGKIKIIAGKYGSYEGVLNIKSPVDPVFMDVMLEEEAEFNLRIKEGYRVIIYPFAGRGFLNEKEIESESAYVLSDQGEVINVKSKEGIRFLLLAGKPLNERVAWYGPIVMNTVDELQTAFRELNEGTFIKSKEPEFL